MLSGAPESARRSWSVPFFLLAPYITYDAIRHLIGAEHPEVSVLGMILTPTSLIGMPLLGTANQRVARQLGSQATHGEGTLNHLCAYLAGTVSSAY